MALHRRQELLLEFAVIVAGRIERLGRQVGPPVAGDLGTAGLERETQEMARLQFEDALPDGVGRRHIAQAEEIPHRLGIDRGLGLQHRQDGLDLAGEHDAVGTRPVIERLDPGLVAGQHQFVVAGVVDRHREHAVQPGEGGGAQRVIEVEDHLGVAARPELVAAPDQFLAQRDVIVDFAAEHDGDAIVGVHRLLAAGQVDDAEPAHAQPDIGGDMKAAVIGAAMEDGVVHPAQQMPDFAAILGSYKSNNTAHYSGSHVRRFTARKGRYKLLHNLGGRTGGLEGFHTT